MPDNDPVTTRPPEPVHLPVVPTGTPTGQLTMGASGQPLPRPTPPPADLEPATPADIAPPAATGEGDPTRAFERKLLEGRVIEAIRQIYDPEIPVNIYELGLIYKVDVRDDNSVHVQMTLTAPACPVAGSLPGQVEQKIESVPEVKSATVELVWDPPWSRDMMSEEAQLQLGLM